MNFLGNILMKRLILILSVLSSSIVAMGQTFFD